MRTAKFRKLTLLMFLVAMMTVALSVCAFGKTKNDVSPFKMLKIGDRDVTESSKHIWMDTVSFRKWDGVVELYMGYTPIRQGDRLRFKLKKKYKAKFILCYTDSKGDSHRVRIKNRGVLPPCGTDYFLECYLSKGRYHAPLCFYPYEEYDEDDYY